MAGGSNVFIAAGTGARERAGAGLTGRPGAFVPEPAPTGRLGMVIFDLILVGVLADEVGEAIADRGEKGVS